MRRLLAGLAVCGLLLVGCQEDDPAFDLSQTSTTVAGTTTSGGGTTLVAPPLAGASTSPVSTPPSEVTLHTDLRVAVQETSERVVFEFRGPVPGYRVSYIERPVTQDGSGDEVKVAGAAVLEIHMEAAADADLSTEAATPTYTGPERVPGFTVIEEVVRTGGSEGVLTWVIGVERRAPFKVSILTGPSRLVIDVALSG